MRVERGAIASSRELQDGGRNEREGRSGCELSWAAKGGRDEEERGCRKLSRTAGK